MAYTHSKVKTGQKTEKKLSVFQKKHETKQTNWSER